MADDAAGTDGSDDDRRPSTSGPDPHRSSDRREHRRGADRDPTEHRDRPDRVDGEDDAVADDDEYRIPLDLSRDDATGDDLDSDADEDDPYGPEPSSTPIEPGDPDLENVIFVFLGAVAMALVLFRIVSLPL